MTTLYHYCPASTFASIISKRHVWLSSLTLSNDTMEGKLVGVTFRGLFEKYGLDRKTVSDIMDIVKKFEEIVDGLGFCLSENGDLLSQWRGYARDGHGFSMGFSKEYLEVLAKTTDDDAPGFTLKKVIYKPNEQEEALKPIFSQIMEDIEAGKLDTPYPPSLLTGFGDPEAEKVFEQKKEEFLEAIRQMTLKAFQTIFHLYTLKNQAFCEEHEWRLISHLLKGMSDECEFRVSRDQLIPYRSIELRDLDILSITDVILGPKNTTPDFVVSKFLQQNGFAGVSVRRSVATYR